jgi:hypothetical protein
MLRLKCYVKVVRMRMTRYTACLFNLLHQIYMLMHKPHMFISQNFQVKDALEMLEEIVGSPFKFFHCWFILRNRMKWNAHLATMHG